MVLRLSHRRSHSSGLGTRAVLPHWVGWTVVSDILFVPSRPSHSRHLSAFRPLVHAPINIDFSHRSSSASSSYRQSLVSRSVSTSQNSHCGGSHPVVHSSFVLVHSLFRPCTLINSSDSSRTSALSSSSSFRPLLEFIQTSWIIMNIQFVTNLPYPKPTLSSTPVNSSKNTDSYSEPSLSPSLDSSAPSEAPVTPKDHLSSSDYHSLAHRSPTASSCGPPAQKISSAWKKTLDEYFKSDDESSVLSSDDEWWLGGNKRFTDQEEPPSGKTRLPAQTWHSKLGRIPDNSTHDSETTSDPGSDSDSQELMSFTRDSSAQTASSSDFAPFFPAPQPIPNLTNSDDFPSLTVGSTAPKTEPKSNLTSSRDSGRAQVPRTASVPWSTMASCKKTLSIPAFPPLMSSSTTLLNARAPQSICSFSSACQRSTETKDADTLTSGKEMRKAASASREESLRTSLPAFQLYDPLYRPPMILLCPSAHHPLSELPELINTVCRDGMRLPSGKVELEGGPYGVVGFDMEWEISYTRGRENRTAVVQLAGRSQVLIVQLSSIPTWYRDGIMPDCLLDLLLDPQIVKIGVGIRNDGLKLLRDHHFGPHPYLNSFLELSQLARALAPLRCATGFSRLISLQTLLADHLNVYLPKNTARISGWTKPLSPTQIDYAASDVIATVRVAQKLFDIFRASLKTNHSHSILDFVESLEPSLERDQRSSKPPVVPIPRQWRTIRALPLEPLADKKHRPVLPDRLVVLKTKVSPRIKQAWKLWYHQGLTIKRCAEVMEIKQFSVVVYLAKMMIHLHMNWITLDEYAGKRLRATERAGGGSCATHEEQGPTGPGAIDAASGDRGAGSSSFEDALAAARLDCARARVDIAQTSPPIEAGNAGLHPTPAGDNREERLADGCHSLEHPRDGHPGEPRAEDRPAALSPAIGSAPAHQSGDRHATRVPNGPSPGSDHPQESGLVGLPDADGAPGVGVDQMPSAADLENAADLAAVDGGERDSTARDGVGLLGPASAVAEDGSSDQTAPRPGHPADRPDLLAQPACLGLDSILSIRSDGPPPMSSDDLISRFNRDKSADLLALVIQFNVPSVLRVDLKFFGCA